MPEPWTLGPSPPPFPAHQRSRASRFALFQPPTRRSRAPQISAVVYLFRYPLRTALAVGLGMAQIGEFAFVLLSSASQHSLIPYQLYMLLMGARPAP